MARIEDVFSVQEMTNWLKAWLALNIAKEGLRDFVDDELFQFKSTIYQSLYSTNALPITSVCTSCSTANILHCPTYGCCKRNNNVCKTMHADPTKQFRPCPNGICDDVRDEIIKFHRYKLPSWKNTSADQWASNHWEIAKCYMPPDGYIGVTSILSTDFNGFISVLLNCKLFDSKISFSIAPPKPCAQCLLSEARDIGKVVRHSPNCKVSSNELNNFFVTLIDLLNDPKALAQDQNAQQAVRKLKQLQNDCLNISVVEISHLLSEAQVAVIKAEQVSDESNKKMKIYIEKCEKTLEDHMKQLTQLSKQQLNEHSRLCTENAERKIEQCTQSNNEHSKRELDERLEICIDKSKNKIIQTTNKCHDDLEKCSQKCTERCTNTLDEWTYVRTLYSRTELDEHTQKCTENSKYDIDQHTLKCVDLIQKSERKQEPTYTEAAADFLQNLIEHYEGKLSHVPVSPLKPNHDQSLSNMYATPAINRIKIEKNGTRTKTDHVQTYKDLLYTDNRLHRRIFVEGEPGKGKTTFAAKLLLDWCKNNISSSEHKTHFHDITTLGTFKFMFHVSLRDSINEREVLKMIEEQIIDEIYGNEERKTIHKLLYEIMKKETCLVVEDGLDEWTCSAGNNALPLMVACHKNCITLITTRPWKMTDERIKNSQIDCLLEIEGVHDPFALSKNVLECLYSGDLDTKHDAFRVYIKENDLGDLILTPMLLTLVVSLWVDETYLTGSACEIYCILLESLLKKANGKGEYFDTANFKCFENTKHIKPNMENIEALSSAAFHLLFAVENKSSLVFTDQTLSKYLSKEQKVFALTSGIISERKTSTLSHRPSTCSFIHKSVQEFLAALHIARHDDVIDDVLLAYFNSVGRVYFEISQVFKFLCGLNLRAGHSLSLTLDTHYRQFKRLSETDRDDLQDIIIDGHLEAKANKLCDAGVNLKLSYFVLCIDDERDAIKYILMKNKYNIQSLQYCTHLESEFNFDDILSSSAHCLKELIICRSSEKLLTADNNIKYLVFEISSFPNLEVLRISEPVSVTLIAQNEVRNITTLELKCKCEDLDLQSYQNLAQLKLGTRVLCVPNSLRNLPNLKRLKLKCQYKGLDLSSYNCLRNVYIGRNVTLLPNTLHHLPYLKRLTLKCKYDGLDLTTCHNLTNLEIDGHVTLLPNTLRNLSNLQHIDLSCICEGLDLSQCHKLTNIYCNENVSLLPNSISNNINLTDLILRCQYDGLDLSPCPNLKVIDLREHVSLLPASLRDIRNITRLILCCTYDMLDLSSCQNIKHLELDENVTLLPFSLNCTQTLNYVNLKCKYDELDLSLCQRLTYIEINEQVTVLPNSLHSLQKITCIILKCKYNGLDLSMCQNLLGLQLGSEVTVLPNTIRHIDNLQLLELKCKYVDLDLSVCHNLQHISLGEQVTLLSNTLPNLYNLQSLHIDCRCDRLDLAESCHSLRQLDLCEKVTLVPNTLSGMCNLYSLHLRCSYDGLDFSNFPRLMIIYLGEHVTWFNTQYLRENAIWVQLQSLMNTNDYDSADEEDEVTEIYNNLDDDEEEEEEEEMEDVEQEGDDDYDGLFGHFDSLSVVSSDSSLSLSDSDDYDGQ